MPDSDNIPDLLPQRLCSEVQLFDLCTLDSCRHKADRFCSDPVLLRRFEKIADDELRSPERYVFEEPDDSEAYDGDGYDYDEEDDELERGNFDRGEETGWQDEE
ncbi:MAG: hypothetical protein PHF56_13510 [Desulfuromonadaceae bacterium]|nr:hypothetical protein [Desulfuromonadaceae bacterium]